MNTRAINAVIFDLDDTLYPERAYAFSGFAAVAAAFEDRLGDSAKAEKRLRELFDSEHRRRVFNALLTERRLSEAPKLIEHMVQVYRKHRPEISLHSDAYAALTRLRGRFKLGLITDGPPESQWAKIDALNLRNRFDEIIVTSELGSGCAKPNPRAFELMIDRLGVEPAGCVYVADNLAKDFIAANALGWVTIQIVRPEGIYHNEVAPEGGSPDHVLDSLDGLHKVFG
jgi:putative hydrolase of the HAD superfamily